MIRLQQHKKRKSVTWGLFVGILALFVILISQIPALRSGLSRTVSMIALPFWQTGQELRGQNGYTNPLLSREELLLQNQELQEEIILLRVQFLTTKLLEQENEELKEILGRTKFEGSMLLGVVLSKPNQSLYDTLVLDVGAEDKVEKGDTVLAYGEVAIGTIDKVYEHSSVVKLFSSPGEETQINVGVDNVTTTAFGIGSGNFKAELPQGVDVKEGDIISFPSIFPRLAGVVERVHIEASGSFQQIFFKSPVNIYELKWVEVLLEN